MTEEEWRTSSDPTQMLAYLDQSGLLQPNLPNWRKVRLFSCGCCRSIWHLLLDERLCKAIAIAEAHADAPAREGRGRPLERARRRIERIASSQGVTFVIAAVREALCLPWYTWRGPAALAARTASAAARASGEPETEARLQAELVRCVFGNPFRPILFDPAWRTPAATALARTAYEENCWEEVPLLADALEEAGCSEAAILSHCRGPGPHARGCWAVDLILDRR